MVSYLLSAFQHNTKPSMDNRNLLSLLGSCRQTLIHWGSRITPAVHQRIPNNGRNMLHHWRHEISLYKDPPVLASGNGINLHCAEMEISEIINWNLDTLAMAIMIKATLCYESSNMTFQRMLLVCMGKLIFSIKINFKFEIKSFVVSVDLLKPISQI